MDKLKEIYNELYRAMIAKDTEVLKRLLDEDFVLIHMTGMRQSKTEFIKAINNGTLNYYSCEDSDIAINDFGSKANIIGKSLVNATVFGGSRSTWRLRLDLCLFKQNEYWKINKITASTF